MLVGGLEPPGDSAVFADPEIRELIIVNWLKYVRQEELTRDEVEIRLNEVLQMALEGMEKTRFNLFRYAGAVDRDGYLRETIDFITVHQHIPGRGLDQTGSRPACSG